MKKLSKFIAVVLALAMVCGVLPAFAAEDDKPVYVVIGDSIAAGTGLDSPNVDSYGAIVANTNGYTYINHAVPGYTTGNLLKLVQEDETVRADLAEADIISISIGGNNFLLSGLVILLFKAMVFKDYSSFDDICDGVYEDFCQIMSEIKSLNSDALILMQTLYNPRYDNIRNVYQEGVDRLNATFVRYIDENPQSMILVDVASAFDGDSNLIASDSIHPNANGHVVIARLLLAELKAAGLGTETEPVISESDDSDKLNTWELFLISIKNIFLTLENLILG